MAGLCACAAGGSGSRNDLGGADAGIPLQERLSPDDGTIITVLETSVTKAYDEVDADTRARFDEAAWENARASLDGRADMLTYSSDGLRIGGLLVRPAVVEGRRLPAVVVNRDGIANRGLDEDSLLVDLARYADAGFVAAASAYRGNRLSQGVDEYGGDDVNDVLSMIALLQRLDYVDPDRVFMVGFGRGGLMTYRAIEMGAPIRAAAVVSGVADLMALEKTDVEISEGFTEDGGWPGLAEIHGEWGGPRRRDELERRTPRMRAQDMRVPLIVVHGRLDEEVPVEQAFCVTTRVRVNGTPIEAVMYGYGDHDLFEQQDEWREKVLDWFQRHDTRAMIN